MNHERIDDTTIAQYIVDTFPGIETIDNMGYKFFFYGSDRMLPLATIATADNPGDNVSNLNRPGIFRLNIGVSRETFQSLFGTGKVDVSAYDFTVLDQIMPHPDYSAQSYICVLNPSATTYENVKGLLAGAYELAVRRHARRQPER